MSEVSRGGRRRDARRHGLGMADLSAILVVAILVVFSFDFFNGFHDAANAIATIVATKVLTPTKAVAMAAAGNFVGMVFITNAIAETIGKGIIDTNVLGVNALPLSDAALFHSMAIIMGGVAGAIAWDLITWLWGLPTSSSHALIGGLVGASALAAGPGSILLPSATNMLLFVFVTGMAFVLGVAAIGPPWGPPSGAFQIPFWVIVGAHASISLGTFFGGWRIVRTMSQRVTHLRPWQGFSAETGGGIALASSALAGIPVSTTHVIASAIMGVGATRRLSAVRWGVARRIFWAWIITIPASAAMGMVVYGVLRLMFGV